MLTGDPAVMRRSLWPWSNDPQGTHHYIEKLAQMEGCTWQDMQGHCAIGLLGAAVLNKAPFSPMGTNN